MSTALRRRRQISLEDQLRWPVCYQLLLLAALLFLPKHGYAAHAPLTTVSEVSHLPAQEAAEHVPVHLVGTVNYYEAARQLLFIEDATGVAFVNTTHPYPIRSGDLVEIDGETLPSFRTVVKDDPQIRVIGRGRLSEPITLGDRSFTHLMSGGLDCRRVILSGVVRSAMVRSKDGSRLELEMLMPGGVVQAYVQEFDGIDPKLLIDAKISIAGVVAAKYNAKWQLMSPIIFANAATDVKVLRPPRVPVASLPLTSVDEVMQTHSVIDNTERVRVRGVVTYYRPGRAIVIEQDGRSLSAATRERSDLALGSVVDLTGFAIEGEYGPALKQTLVFPVGRMQRISPQPVSYVQAISGAYSDDLISVKGHLLSEIHSDTSDTLSLLVDNHPISVTLQQPAEDKWLPKLPLGTEITVTGICRVTLTDDWAHPGTTPLFFRMEMRSRDDLQVVAMPSWWTVTHLLQALSALLVVSLTITAWALILRRRVSHQTAVIARSMQMEQVRSRLLEAISSRLPLRELLEDICFSFETLSPELRLACYLAADVHGSSELTVGGYRPMESLSAGHHFESALKDGRGVVLGWFQGSRHDGGLIAASDLEVLNVATGLVNLAVDQRRMYEDLNYTSTHDQLTSLPNRRAADQRLESAMSDADEHSNRVAVAYIDVDCFKQVNDQHGHKIGDLYLQQICSRLGAEVRQEDTLARIGGDEFLLIAAGLQSIETAEAYRKRLQGCFDPAFELDGITLTGCASIGLAVFPDHGSSAEDLKRHADIDMYAAKNKSRIEKVARSSPPVTGLFSAADLEAALQKEQFTLYYQPQFSSAGKLIGLEALVRLNDPILGIVNPDEFIAVAERNFLILPLGRWILHRALADAAQWQLDDLGIRMMVNIAARQAEAPGFADDVIAALEQAHLPGRCLELELTERTMMRNMAQARPQFERLRDAGVRIAIDDFGTEHSSLSVIHQLPFDTLKLDRSFVRALSHDPKVSHIIGAIVSMAQTIDKRLVVEGVETRTEWNALSKLGEMDLQGFLFSRPKPAEDIADLLETWRSRMPVGPADGSEDSAEAGKSTTTARSVGAA